MKNKTFLVLCGFLLIFLMSFPTQTIGVEEDSEFGSEETLPPPAPPPSGNAFGPPTSEVDVPLDVPLVRINQNANGALEVFENGQYRTFVVKGVKYNPVPVGQFPDYTPAGTAMCRYNGHPGLINSPYRFDKPVPAGTHFNVPSPYIGTCANNQCFTCTEPNPLDNVNILNRDFDHLQRMNINTITVDATNLTPTSPIFPLAEFYGFRIIMQYPIDPFMDFMDQNAKSQVMNTLVGKIPAFQANSTAHNAILLWSIGENNNTSICSDLGAYSNASSCSAPQGCSYCKQSTDCCYTIQTDALYNFVDNIASSLKAAYPNIHPIINVAEGLVNVSASNFGSTQNIDMFGVNFGPDFTFWNTYGTYKNLMQGHSEPPPLLISGFGHTLTMTQAQVTAADFDNMSPNVNALWQDLQTRGYINSNGDIQQAFYNIHHPSNFTLSTQHMPKQCEIYFALQMDSNNKVTLNDFQTTFYPHLSILFDLQANSYVHNNGLLSNRFFEYNVSWPHLWFNLNPIFNVDYWKVISRLQYAQNCRVQNEEPDHVVVHTQSERNQMIGTKRLWDTIVQHHVHSTDSNSFNVTNGGVVSDYMDKWYAYTDKPYVSNAFTGAFTPSIANKDHGFIDLMTTTYDHLGQPDSNYNVESTGLVANYVNWIQPGNIDIVIPREVTNKLRNTLASFIRGDVDQNGVVNTADSTYLNTFLNTQNDGVLLCDDAADANDDGQVNASDVTHLNSYLSGGATLASPNSLDELDYTPDMLECHDHYVVYNPNHPTDPIAAPAVIAVHGLGENALGMIERFKPYSASNSAVIIAPEFNKYAGYQWLTNGEDVTLMRIMDYVKQHHSIDDTRVFIHGFSAGSQFSHRFAQERPTYVRAAAPFAGGSWNTWVYNTPEAKAVHYYIGVGADDTQRRSRARAFHNLLISQGYTSTFKLYPGVGHWFTQAMYDDITAFFSSF